MAEGHGHSLVRMKESCVLGGEGGREGEGEVLSVSGVSLLCCKVERVIGN